MSNKNGFRLKASFPLVDRCMGTIVNKFEQVHVVGRRGRGLRAGPGGSQSEQVLIGITCPPFPKQTDRHG